VAGALRVLSTESKAARRTLSELLHRISLWDAMTKVSRETGEASLISQAEEYRSFIREAEALIQLNSLSPDNLFAC
jgi:hypothetical protein